MAGDPYKYFRLEARELLDQLASGVLELDKGAGEAVIQRLLRVAHTLKGAARVVRQSEIADHAHAIEEALAPYRDSATLPSKLSTTTLLELVDAIAQRVAALELPRAAATPSTMAPTSTGLSLRADLAELDALLDGVVEAHGRLGAMRAMTTDLADARQLAAVLEARLATSRESGPDEARALAERLRDLVARCERTFETGIDQMARELVQVKDAAEHLRLISAGSVFTSFERTVRDAALELGKEVAFEARGVDIRLDAHVLVTVQGALVQLARNAVAHGIELPAQRRAAGKPPVGRVTIEVSRRGRRVVFACVDDGRGVDLEAVRRVALRRGLAVGTHDASELVRMLLRGGITTSASVTEVAGRGVGLDVVRDVMARLGGEVVVRTGPTGTAFELVLPSSLSSIEAVLVEARGLVAALPVESVRRARQIAHDEISHSSHGEAVIEDGRAIPFLPLASALRYGEVGHPAAWIGVAVEHAGDTAMIGVERLRGTGPLVVRPIPELAAADRVVAGAALDSEGNPQLVLDPERLIALAHSPRPVSVEPATVRRSVLVIDDSLTTRMLEQTILESAGYDVDTAVSGEQGLEAARRKRYALFLVDVEMPGIDGFTFIERVRADPDLRHTPAILVTSRASVEDRRRGEEVGAQGYMVKSEFDQVDLLAQIARMVR